MQFLDLNEDVHFQILESLNFDELLSLSETNQYFSSLAQQLFRRKYSHKFVEIKSKNGKFLDDESRIYLRDVGSAQQILKKFGQSIFKLKVNHDGSYDFNETEMKSMSKLIDLYCTDTLTEIVIFDGHQTFFDQITKPFRNVESVEIYGTYKNLNGSGLSFVEIFPAMKSLFLSQTTFKQEALHQIVQHFPHLVEFSVHFFDWNFGRNVEESDIERVLRMNPQIKRLKLHSPTEYILRVANEILPNLEFLRIEPNWHVEISNSGPRISFKTVKILQVKPTDNIMHIDRYLEGIRFENLDELRAMIAPDLEFTWWISFIRQNSHLKRFKSIEGSILEENLTKLIEANNLNLKEISITLGVDVKVASLVKFVNEQQKIEKFSFKFTENGETKISALRERFNFGCIIRNAADSIELKRLLT